MKLSGLSVIMGNLLTFNYDFDNDKNVAMRKITGEPYEL